MSYRFPSVQRCFLTIIFGLYPALCGSRPAYALPSSGLDQPSGTIRQHVENRSPLSRPPGQGPDDGEDDSPLDRDRIAEAYVPASRSVGERDGIVRVPVTLDRSTKDPLEVTYAVEPGSAQAGVHYRPVSGKLRFDGPGDKVDYIDVPILNNTYSSGSLTFTVRLVSQSIGAPLPSASTTTVTIKDDEPLPAARIVAPGGGYSVPETAGAAVLTVSVPFTSTSPISVTYETLDNTAISGVDYQSAAGELVIPAGQTSATASVPILNNASLTGDRFFTFRLQRQTPGVLGSPASALVTITDAQQDPNVRFELSSYNVPRMIGTAAIAVMLSAPSAFTATVMYTMSDGTALAGVDYTPSSGTLTFAPGETNRLIEVPILESGPDVGDRIFTLGLSNPTRATLGDNYRATVLIRATNALRVQLPVVLGTYDIYGENEPNGAIATANGPIESGLTYHGVYDVNQVDQFGLDRDTWMFGVAVPGPVTVVVTGDDPGHQVRLLNASGVDIPGGFSGDPGSMASFSVNVTAAGNYYVRVINSAQLGSAEYQLQVTFP